MSLFRSSAASGLLPMGRSSVLSILDVGSSKIVCLIARLRPLRGSGEALRGRTHAIEILGLGHQRSQGVKSGVVVDLDAVERAIRLAVDAAERRARMTVSSLLVTLTCGRLASETWSGSVSVGGREIGEGDVGRVLAAGRSHSINPGRAVVHSLPIGYSLDEQSGIADPRSMIGDRLGVAIHVVSADEPPLRNLELAINRSHLSIERVVATPYASALAVLDDDEMELGSVVVDLGGGTTSTAVFTDGQFAHADAIALGGNHVTVDIARGLSTRVEDAERLKTMDGTALPSSADDHEMLCVPPIGGGEDGYAPTVVPHSTLTKIIRARVEETLETVRDRINKAGFAPLLARRLVLTGGGSQLAGIADVARRIMARNVRLGRPLGVTGMPDVARGPAFAAAVGLLIYPQVALHEQIMAPRQMGAVRMTGTGYLARVGQWFRESF